MRRDFETRCAALQRLLCLPPAAAEPYDSLAEAAGEERLAQLLLHGLPAQAAQQQQQEQASPDAARAAAGDGVALLGSAAFEARARLLALCGWDLKLMSTAAKPAAGSGDAAADGAAARDDHGLPAHVGPESAALECGLCSAKAGLWAFFPQCKPHVLQAARRRGGAGGTVASPSSAAVAKTALSRNVAADIGTTIAGGAMQTGGGAAGAAPFSAPAAPAFGARAQNGTAAPAAAAGQQQDATAAAAPFGAGGTSGASLPVFGIAALQAAAPAAGAARRDPVGLGGASIKRKQPDFSWSAVMADIDAKAAAEKRSRGGAAAGGAAAAQAGSSASASGGARGGTTAAAPATAQQQRAAAIAAGKYAGAAATPLDPLLLHRPFCPWVNGSQVGTCGRLAPCGEADAILLPSPSRCVHRLLPGDMHRLQLAAMFSTASLSPVVACRPGRRRAAAAGDGACSSWRRRRCSRARPRQLAQAATATKMAAAARARARAAAGRGGTPLRCCARACSRWMCTTDECCAPTAPCCTSAIRTDWLHLCEQLWLAVEGHRGMVAQRTSTVARAGERKMLMLHPLEAALIHYCRSYRGWGGHTPLWAY